MPAKKHKPEEINGKLREVKIVLAEGSSVTREGCYRRNRICGFALVVCHRVIQGTRARPIRFVGMKQQPPPAATKRRSAPPRSTARLFGHLLHPMLVPFPITFFIGAQLTDLAYLGSANITWSNFSIWLITAGLMMGGLAALTGIIDDIDDKRIRAARPATPHMIINLSVQLSKSRWRRPFVS